MQNRFGFQFGRGIILVCILGFLIACRSVSPGSNAPTLEPGATQTKSGTIRFGAFSTPNASNMPWLMALDQLEAQGYTVEKTFYATSDVAVESLARGDSDLAAVGVAALAAIPKGAGVTTIVAHNANPFSIVAAKSISRCSDLDGRSFAIGARTIITLLVELYLVRDCDKAAPTFVTLTDSQARRAALLAGQVDATTIEIADQLQLSAEAPGKFHSLVDLSKAFPTTIFALGMTSNDFAAAHPEIVSDYVASVVSVNRAIRANPQLLRDAMVKHLDYTPEQAGATADAYLDANVWDLNGGLSEQSIETTLEFLAAQGTLPATLGVDDVSDLSFLNSVLAQVGRE